MFLTLGSRERLEIRDSFEFEPTAQTVRKIDGPGRPSRSRFSTSLLSPGANIKPDSDVVGAARRALARWSSLSNINFVVTWSPATSVSPADAGDGISLLTIASHSRKRSLQLRLRPPDAHASSSIRKPATSPKQTSASIHDHERTTELSCSFQLTAHRAPTISKLLSHTRLDICSGWTIPRFCRRRCRHVRLSMELSDCRL